MAEHLMARKDKVVNTPFDTEADMVADLALLVGEVAITLGETSVGDGGGQTFKIVDSGGDVTLDNGKQAKIVSKHLTATGTQTVGAALDYRVIRLDDITSLSSLNTAALVDGQQFHMTGWRTGSDLGGGDLYFDSSRPKTDHDGGTVFAFDATPPTDFNDPAQLEAFLNAGSGLSGNGCLVRPEPYQIDITAFGGWNGMDITAPANALLQVADLVIPSGWSFTCSAITIPSGRTIRTSGKSRATWGVTSSSVISSSDVEIYGFEFTKQTAVSALQVAFVMDGLSNLTIDNCYFNDTRIQRIGAEDTSKNLHVKNSEFNCVSNGSSVRSIETSCDGVYITGCEFTGEDVYEFLKFSGAASSGETVVRYCTFNGSTIEEICDAYTNQGPLFFEYNEINITGGGVLIFKADGGAGPDVSAPYYSSIKGNRITSSDTTSSLFSLGGSNTLAWYDKPQKLDFLDNKMTLTGNVDNGYIVVDIRGLDTVNIEQGNEIKLTGTLPTRFYAVEAGGGIGYMSCQGNNFESGSFYTATGSTTTGVSYGSNQTLMVANNQFRNFQFGALVLNTAADCSLSFVNNDIYIDQSNITVTTRPINGDTSGLKSLNLLNNVVHLDAATATGGGLNPLGVLSEEGALYIDFGNTWNRRVFYRSAAPTSGDYDRGDIVWNTTPSNGGNAGWVCTVTGSPGSWKTFGTIEA